MPGTSMPAFVLVLLANWPVLPIALMDLAGKAWGVPCWQMLGGKFRDQIRVYADTPSRRDPEEICNVTNAFLALGALEYLFLAHLLRRYLGLYGL